MSTLIFKTADIDSDFICLEAGHEENILINAVLNQFACLFDIGTVLQSDVCFHVEPVVFDLNRERLCEAGVRNLNRVLNRVFDTCKYLNLQKCA